MGNVKAIILAAGEGTRMKSKKSKVLHEIFDKSMVEYVIGAVNGAGAYKICVVVGHNSDEVKNKLSKYDLDFAEQKERLGTGHAVMQAADFIDENDDIIVLYGDTPLITYNTLSKLIEFHRKENNGASIISTIVDNPEGYGHIIRDENGAFVKNIEHKDASEVEKKVKEINAGVYCFNGKWLKKALSMLKNDNVQKEYYLPDCLEIILKNGGGVNAVVIEDSREFLGVNSRAQLSEVTEIMKERINKEHMDKGVTIIDTHTTYISSDVKIGMDTVIYPNTILEGNTIIGEDCIIGPNTMLSNITVGNKTKVQFTRGMDSKIGNNTTVGPFAYIRPNSNIGDDIKIGDFVEVKNSVIGNGTKVSHLTYIGDSDVGERINFGCGTVTVNYDGKNKYRTTIEDDVFIGCNANLVAPVNLKKGSYVAAGSTITHDVPEESLAVARQRQKNIPGWSKKH